MIEIRRLERFTIEDQKNFGTNGYISPGKFAVSRDESPESTVITIKYVALNKPYVKIWPHDPNDFDRYAYIIPHGWSFGAHENQQLVGAVISEPRDWNKTLWIWDVHVAESHRRMGIGRSLMDNLAEQAKKAGFRILGLETQNTNVPAITFYRKVGFEIDGIDLSYYTNDVDGEVAIFMKRKL